MLEIRGQTISFACKRKKVQCKLEQKLIHEIQKIENDTCTEIDRADLENKKEELESIRVEKLKGHIIRSRVQWLTEEERPSQYFCSLEAKSYTEKTVKKVISHNGKVITNQKKILEEIRLFYANLFDNKDDLLQIDKIRHLPESYNIPKLCDTKAASLEGKLTLAEISNALKNMKNNKSPGIDGFSSEFFKVFWCRIKFFVLRSLNHSFEKGILPTTLRQCIISCLLKGNKPRQF